MRILHLHSGNLFGGIESMLLTLLDARAKTQSSTARVALCFRGRLFDELTRRGVHVDLIGDVRLSRPSTARRARARLRELLTEWSPDVVVVHLPWTQAVFGPTLKAVGVRVIQWVHGPVTGVLGLWASRSLPDALISNSAFTTTQLPAAYRNVPTTVIRYPVSLPPDYSEAQLAETRASLGTAATDVVIVQASRFEPWKGHVPHLRALGKLAAVPGWVLWIVAGAQRPAEARYEQELRALALELGIAARIRFTGEQPDVSRFLAAADIYCQPNTGPEPFGLAYIEALAAGLPVIATSIGAAREIVSPETGLLVEANNVDALAEALRLLISDRERRRTFGRAGAARAAELCEATRQIAAVDAYVTAFAGGAPA